MAAGALFWTALTTTTLAQVPFASKQTTASWLSHTWSKIGVAFDPPTWPRVEKIEPNSLSTDLTELKPGLLLLQIEGTDVARSHMSEAFAIFARKGVSQLVVVPCQSASDQRTHIASLSGVRCFRQAAR
jgi:RNA:NAD 2'-phosphotransferase (TPT1/KptA family)